MTEKMEKGQQSSVGKWLSYRPEIKVFDATIRDGGLMNDHQFDDKTVKAVYQACVEAGVDYMEIGYKNSKKIFPPAENGPWKYCDEEDVRRIVGDNDTPLKLSAMADAEKSDYQTDILPKEESVLDMIRVATYIHQIPLALEMVRDAHDKGYETTLNLMAVSVVQESELDEAVAMIAESPVQALYVVDSFGALYSEEVQALVEKYLKAMKPRGKEVGIHCHNNQQLGFGNTIEALVRGANLLDASMAGLGRGAGNCPLELLLGFLHNPKFRLRPVLECIQNHIEPMRAELMWGYDYAYMITGLLNQHPRAAMAFNAARDRDQIVRFFDSMVEEE
jgi:4-hydroxy 2-oxovalerate aldolase